MPEDIYIFSNNSTVGGKKKKEKQRKERISVCNGEERGAWAGDATSCLGLQQFGVADIYS